MKAVLRSIKPYWLYLILTGKKTIEVSKSCPKSKDWNKVVEMYCSKDIRSFNRIPEKDREWMHKYLGKVAGLFVCDDITKIVTWQRTWFDILQHPIGTTTEYGIWNDDFKQMCLTWKEINDYGKKKPLYGWHISQLKIYDKPKALWQFYKCGAKSFEELCDTGGGEYVSIANTPRTAYIFVKVGFVTRRMRHIWIKTLL